MNERIILLLVGAALGQAVKWLFDQFQQKQKLDNLQQILIEEFQDIQQRLQLMYSAYEISLRAYALGGVWPELPLGLSNPVYQKHYTEVALRLGASQRESLSLIHGHLDGINTGLKKLQELMPGTQGFPVELLDRWGDAIKTQCRNVATAYWHVSYHLSNKELPTLGGQGTPEHDAFKKQIRDTNENLERLIKNARENLTKEALEKAWLRPE